MTMSRKSLEIILDLIEIKINALQIHDNDDAREVNNLRKCRQELMLFINSSSLQALKSDTTPPLTKKSNNKRSQSPF